MTQNSNIRRIDDLGRIVIPKDIRKKLHIVDSEPLEIYIEGDEIRVKKYSSLPNIKDYSASLLDAGKRVTENEYILTTREKILFSTDPQLQDKELSDKLKSLVLSCTDTKNELIEYTIENTTLNAHANIVPIIIDNDRSGLLIEYNKTKELNSNEVIKIFKNMIEKQLNNY